MHLAEARRPAVYTIPVHRAFSDALVAGIMRAHGGTLLGLAAGLVLLPNNRAVTAVRDAFIRYGGGALLLPRLVALGDDDLDDAFERLLRQHVGDVLDVSSIELTLEQIGRAHV